MTSTPSNFVMISSDYQNFCSGHSARYASNIETSQCKIFRFTHAGFDENEKKSIQLNTMLIQNTIEYNVNSKYNWNLYCILQPNQCFCSASYYGAYMHRKC